MMVHLGYGHYVQGERIVGVIAPGQSKPIIRALGAARRRGDVVNLTVGRPRRSAVFMDNGVIFLSGISVPVLVARIRRGEDDHA